MATLAQWYNKLSESAKSVVRCNCQLWFDQTQPDLYRKVELADTDAIKNRMASISRYSNSDNKDFFAIAFLSLYKQTHTEEEFNHMLLTMTNKYFYKDEYGDIDKNITAEIVLMSDDIQVRRDLIKMLYTDKYDRIPWYNALYLIEDFDNIPTEIKQFQLRGIDSVNTGLIEILGMDIAKQFVIEEPDLLRIKPHEENDLFDEVFFCENGWSDEQKTRFIKRYYGDTYSHKIVSETMQERFEDFIERIVAVDKSYLRNMYSIIAECPALGNKIYDAKKPDSELTGNETPEMRFRYSKLIRKLARIANICARKSLSGVNGKALKEISPLIKLYGYNYYDIYDCIMDMEENA